jgi:hypothetical protein
MSADPSAPERTRDQTALNAIAISASRNIPGAELVSITVRRRNEPLRTVAATDALAEQADGLQYELHEGPCYAAVTNERFVLVNDLAATADFPRYGPEAVELGIRAQAAIQLIHDRETAGLNLYARTPGAFDRATVQIAELFAEQAGALLGYAAQVEQLSEALHTRSDIGTAVGIVMERYNIDRERAFAFLVRNSNNRNMKLRLLAQQVIDSTFQSTQEEDERSTEWP